jgi:hypothetical protein
MLCKPIQTKCPSQLCHASQDNYSRTDASKLWKDLSRPSGWDTRQKLSIWFQLHSSKCLQHDWAILCSRLCERSTKIDFELDDRWWQPREERSGGCYERSRRTNGGVGRGLQRTLVTRAQPQSNGWRKGTASAAESQFESQWFLHLNSSAGWSGQLRMPIKLGNCEGFTNKQYAE